MTSFSVRRAVPTAQEIKDYEEQGFCVARGMLDEAGLRLLRENADRFIAQEVAKLGGRDVNFVDGKKETVNSIHKLHADAFFASVLNESGFCTFAAALLGEGVKSRACEMFAKPAGVGLRVPMHQDNAYWCVSPANALTAWIALDHADFTNGGVFYVEGSHKLGLVPHGASGAPGSSQELLELKRYVGLKATCTPLAPGDVFFHHVLTAHWSAPNQSERSRRGITMQYMGASTKIDLELKRAYEESLLKQVRDREASTGKG